MAQVDGQSEIKDLLYDYIATLTTKWQFNDWRSVEGRGQRTDSVWRRVSAGEEKEYSANFKYISKWNDTIDKYALPILKCASFCLSFRCRGPIMLRYSIIRVSSIVNWAENQCFDAIQTLSLFPISAADRKRKHNWLFDLDGIEWDANIPLNESMVEYLWKHTMRKGQGVLYIHLGFWLSGCIYYVLSLTVVLQVQTLHVKLTFDAPCKHQ
jgi:hypothetical protein